MNENRTRILIYGGGLLVVLLLMLLLSACPAPTSPPPTPEEPTTQPTEESTNFGFDHAEIGESPDSINLEPGILLTPSSLPSFEKVVMTALYTWNPTQVVFDQEQQELYIVRVITVGLDAGKYELVGYTGQGFEFYSIPLEKDGLHYYPVAFGKLVLSSQHLTFPCAYHPFESDESLITACQISLSNFNDLSVMPLHKQWDLRKYATDVATFDEYVLVSVLHTDHGENYQLYKWNPSTNAVTQLTGNKVDHVGAYGNGSGLYFTYSFTGEVGALQYIQIYRDGKFLGAATQGMDAAMVGDDMYVFRRGDQCHPGFNCPQVWKFNHVSDVEQLWFEVPGNISWPTYFGVSGERLIIVGDAGETGAYSCPIKYYGRCTEILEPTTNDVVEVVGFPNESQVILRVGSEYQLLNIK